MPNRAHALRKLVRGHQRQRNALRRVYEGLSRARAQRRGLVHRGHVRHRMQHELPRVRGRQPGPRDRGSSAARSGRCAGCEDQQHGCVEIEISRGVFGPEYSAVVNLPIIELLGVPGGTTSLNTQTALSPKLPLCDENH